MNLRRIGFVAILSIFTSLGAFFPLWTIEFNAPVLGQKWASVYVHPLNGVIGDINNINIINHYVGLAEINLDSIVELTYLPIIYPILSILTVVAGLFYGRRYGTIAWLIFLIVIIGMPIMVYLWLYNFTHVIQPGAPIKIEPFDPPFIGEYKIANFQIRSYFGLALYLPALSCILLIPPPLGTRLKHMIIRTKTKSPLAVLLLLILFPNMIAYAEAKTQDSSLQELIDSTPAGGTLMLKAGTYYGPVRIIKPIGIVGEGLPVVDGRGHGDVILIETNDVTITGLRVRNSNPEISKESAGIKILANNSRIIGNLIEDTLFSVYLQGAHNTIVERNQMTGFPTKNVNDKGHGVYLWYSFNSSVIGNVIQSVKDAINADHSYNSRIAENKMSYSRYGVHLMYSDGFSVISNTIDRNLVGMALMYSSDLMISRNVVKENKGVAVSHGIFVRECGNIVIEQNLILGHMNSLIIESTPSPPSSSQTIRNNSIAFNYVGIQIDSNSGGKVYQNNFFENLEQVKLVGSGSRIDWQGNFWSDYRGLGDIAHKVENPLHDLMDTHPQLMVFAYSPAYTSLELFKKSLPAMPKVRAIDNSPLVKPSENFQASVAPKGDNTWLFAALLLTFAPVTLILAAHRRPRVGGNRGYKPNKAV
ncbi:MAG: nitrous oxide reductase family maturation protein NosD [Thaumarchaeota archaeon]|nr:nitrous oxide reductase family maturation protein NosD [Nitrososphaerota archaeon]